MRRILLSLTLVVATFSTSHSQFLSVNNTMVLDRDGKEIILRGMGLGGWMLQEGYMLRVRGIGQQQHVIKAKLTELVGEQKTNEFYDAWLANHTRKIDIDSMAAWGFNSVRLAMHYNLYTLPTDQEPIAGQNTWLDKGFAMTDSLLKWCEANKLYLILDLHAAPGGQGNDLNISDRDPSKPSLWQDEKHQQKMIALWRKLAERYANEEWIGAYDIINEPNWGFQNPDDKNGCGEQLNEPLKKLMIDVTNAIRQVDKNHIIIVEGNCWGNNYNNIFPLWDKNMIISFHKYWNYNDKNSIQKFLDIREKQNAPVWLGESGENSNVWFRDAIHLMETNKIGWAWWPLKKLGFNNPLEVKVPAGYQKIIDYWGGGPKPTSAEAAAGLDELAENLKLENCIYHKDVIDAMFRQTKSDATIPFHPKLIDQTGSINAIDFDLGRNRYAYFDKDTGNYYISTGGPRTSGNNGRVYRNDGVDIKSDEKGIYVSDFEAGEWIQYTVTVKTQGLYAVELEVQADEPANVSVKVNDVLTKPLTLPVSQSWRMIEVGKFQFKKGKNVMRVYSSQAKFNFKTLKLSKVKA